MRIAAEKDMEGCLWPVVEITAFYSRSNWCRAVEVRHRKKGGARGGSTTARMMLDLILLPACMKGLNLGVRIGRVPLEMQELWVVVAIVAAAHDSVKRVSVRGAQQVKWWDLWPGRSAPGFLPGCQGTAV